MKNKIFSVLFLLLCGVFFSCNNEVDGGGNETPSGPDMPVNDFSGNVFEGRMEDGTVFGKLKFITDYSATLSVSGDIHHVDYECKEDNVATIKYLYQAPDGGKGEEITLTTTKLVNEEFSITFPEEICQLFDPNASGDIVVTYRKTEAGGITAKQKDDVVEIEVSVPENINTIIVVRNDKEYIRYSVNQEYYENLDPDADQHEMHCFEEGNLVIKDEYITDGKEYEYSVEFHSNYDYEDSTPDLTSSSVSVVISNSGNTKGFEKYSASGYELTWNKNTNTFIRNVAPTYSPTIPENMEANILAAYYSSSMGEGFVRYDEDPIPVSLEYEINDLEYQDMYIHIQTDNVSTDETVKKYYAYRGKISKDGIIPERAEFSYIPFVVTQTANGVELKVTVPAGIDTIKVNKMLNIIDGDYVSSDSTSFDYVMPNGTFTAGEVTILDEFVTSGSNYTYSVSYEINNVTRSSKNVDITVETVPYKDLQSYTFNNYSASYDKATKTFTWDVEPQFTEELPAGYFLAYYLDYQDNKITSDDGKSVVLSWPRGTYALSRFAYAVVPENTSVPYKQFDPIFSYDSEITNNIPKSIEIPSALSLKQVEEGVELSLSIPAGVSNVYFTRYLDEYNNYETEPQNFNYCMPNSSEGETQYFPEGTISFVDNFVEQGKTYVYEFRYYIYDDYNYEYSDPITLSDETKYLELQNYSITDLGILDWDGFTYKYSWNEYPLFNGALPNDFIFDVTLYFESNEGGQEIYSSSKDGEIYLNEDEVYTLKEAKISSLKSTEEEDYITPKIYYTYSEKDVNSEVVSAATGIPQLKKAYLPLELTQVTEGVQLSLTIPENVNLIDVYRNDEKYMSYSMPYSSEGETQYLTAGEISFVDNFVEQGSEYSYYVTFSYFDAEEIWFSRETETKSISLSDETKYLELQNYSITDLGILDWDGFTYKYSWNEYPLFNGALPNDFIFDVTLYFESNEGGQEIYSSSKDGEIYLNEDEVYTLKEAKISSLKSTEEEDYITPKIYYTYSEKDVNSEVVSAATGIPQLKKAYLPLELTQVTEGVQLSLTIPENVNLIDVYRNDEKYMSYSMPYSSEGETQYLTAGEISFVDNFVEQGSEYSYYVTFSYFDVEEICFFRETETKSISLSNETKYLELQNYSITDAGTLTFTKNPNYYYEWNPLPTINGTLPDSYEYEVSLGYSTNEWVNYVRTSQATGSVDWDIDEVSTLQEVNLNITKKYSENYTIPEVSYNNTYFELDISSLGAGIPTTISAE